HAIGQRNRAGGDGDRDTGRRRSRLQSNLGGGRSLVVFHAGCRDRDRGAESDRRRRSISVAGKTGAIGRGARAGYGSRYRRVATPRSNWSCAAGREGEKL